MDRSTKQKINKETETLNETLGKMDLIVIFRTFHENAEEYTFFSSSHRTFSRINHILHSKSNFRELKKIISIIFSDRNAMRLDINYRGKTKQNNNINNNKTTVKNKNTWRLNNKFLNNEQDTEDIERKSKYS